MSLRRREGSLLRELHEAEKKEQNQIMTERCQNCLCKTCKYLLKCCEDDKGDFSCYPGEYCGFTDPVTHCPDYEEQKETIE